MNTKYEIKRYNLQKEFISTGSLTVISEGQITHLKYYDSIVDEAVSELNHPLAALENLRKLLENKYKSIIGCIGCRIDTAYRPTGGYGTYIIIDGEPATESANIFEPTDEVTKLCTVEEHRVAYKKWINSLRRKV